MKYISLLLLVSCGMAYATDDCRGNSCNDKGDIDVRVTGGDVTVPVTTGDVNVSNPVSVSSPVSVEHVSKNKAIALSNSLGDVDIAECLGSTQWNTPVFGKQKLVLNQVCMAEFYLKLGKFQLAGMALCNVPEILAEFTTEIECEDAHDFTPIASPQPKEIIVEPSVDLQQQVVHQQIDAEVESLEERLSKLEAGKREEAKYKASLIKRIQGTDNDSED